MFFSKMSTIKYQISNLQSALSTAYPEDEARSLAWWIAEELTGKSRTELQFGCKDTTFSPIMQEKSQEIISRLLHFEPIQYIFGHTLWCGLDLLVTPATLIPRPETAELVERINLKSEILNLKSQIHVLDVGTGSGCIAIALKKAHPSWSVTGIDISPEAIAIARENARRNNVEVNFQVADIFDFNEENPKSKILNPKYDVVVSNPPYICESEKSSMRPNVLDFEPSSALFVPDSDPLKFYRKIAEIFSPITRNPLPVTHLFFEINEAYGEELKQLLSKLGTSKSTKIFMAKTELSKLEWLAKAQAYCARAEHCAADVRRKFYEWGLQDAEIADFIEQNLYADNFLNDRRFCEAYVHDKVAYQSWGRLKIQAGLRALQLPESEIRAALENIDETAYFDNLRKLIRARKADSEDKRLRFLLQRGFTYEEIKGTKI